MLLHHIFASDVRRGDHIYRWRNLKLFPGIAVQRNDDPSEIFVVMTNGLNTFRLVTLSEFKGRGILRRALYDQGDSYLHSIKLSGTSFIEKKRPVEEVEQNALLLLDIAHTNPERIQELFVDGTRDFARLCCTINHEQWRNYLRRNVNSVEQISHLISTTSTDAHKIKESKNNTETPNNQLCCPICMDRLCNVVVGCGHLACSECAQRLDICHICRQDIHQKLNFFWPS